VYPPLQPALPAPCVEPSTDFGVIVAESVQRDQHVVGLSALGGRQGAWVLVEDGDVRLLYFAALHIALIVPLAAQDRLWPVSAVSYAGAQAADAASSCGRAEVNPLYGQRFTARDAALKGGITAAVLLTEWVMGRRSPRLRRSLAFVNFGLAGATAGVAWRNYRQ